MHSHTFSQVLVLFSSYSFYFWSQQIAFQGASLSSFSLHSVAVCHSHRFLLLGLGAHPVVAAAAQKVPRFSHICHIRHQFLPGGRCRRSLYPRHGCKSPAPLPHRGGGAGFRAALGDGGQQRNFSRWLWHCQSVSATTCLHALMLLDWPC